MSSRDPRLLSEKEIDLAAAQWLVRIDNGLSAVEQDELMEWLAADPRNGEWLTRHRLTWKALDALVEWRPEHSAEPNPDLLARRFNPRLWVTPALILAVAAAVAVGVFLTRPRAVAKHAIVDVATTYERRVLEDGSIIEMKPGSAVSVDFTALARRVNLERGEAHFTVAKNKHWPFVVSAAGVDVLAVGTAFDVRLDARSVAVLVTEGRVKVGPPGDSLVSSTALATFTGEMASHSPGNPAVETFVGAGQQTVVALAAGNQIPQVVAVSPNEIIHALAWEPSLLSFDSQPLATVVAEFNRRNRLQIVIADPSIASLPIVASIRSDNVEGFVRLLEQSSSVTADRTDATITLRKAR